MYDHRLRWWVVLPFHCDGKQASAVRRDEDAAATPRNAASRYDAPVRFAATGGRRAAAAAQSELKRLSDELKTRQTAFEARAISYKELQDENAIIKRDLKNLELQRRKLELDGHARDKNHEAIENRVNELCSVYLKDNVKWISSSVNPNNFSQCKQRLVSAIARCRAIGGRVQEREEAELIAALRGLRGSGSGCV